MKIIETGIKGLVMIEPRVFEDPRGYFYESYNKNTYSKSGISMEFVQDNESQSQYGVIRGLHFQKAPYAQTKLVRVIHGSIYDVALDLRRGSPTFGKWFGIELTRENRLQMYVPKGFAHGFSVISDIAVVNYKCDEYYQPSSEAGIRFDDPSLGIDWKIDSGRQLISDKDNALPFLQDADYNFTFAE